MITIPPEMNSEEPLPTETHQDPFDGLEGSFPLYLSFEQARRLTGKVGISVSEFVRSGMEKMLRERHPALPQDLVRLYHDILGTET